MRVDRSHCRVLSGALRRPTVACAGGGDDCCVPGVRVCSSCRDHRRVIKAMGRSSLRACSSRGWITTVQLGHATAQNATCTDCQWTVSPACLANGPNDDALCMMAVSSCPRPAIMMRVYLRHGTGPWQLIDTICLGPGQRPTPVADVE